VARRANTIHPGILIGFVVLVIVAGVAALIANDLKDQVATATKKAADLETQKQQASVEWQNEKTLRIEQGRFIYGWDNNGENGKMDISALEDWLITRFPDKIPSSATTKEQKVKALLNAGVIVTDWEEEPGKKLLARIAEIQEQYQSSKTNLEGEIDSLNQSHTRRVNELQASLDEKDTQLGNQAA